MSEDTPDDTKNWQAGNGLGQKLKDDVEKQAHVYEGLLKESHSTPLFLRDSSEGNLGNAQDEKDETEE